MSEVQSRPAAPRGRGSNRGGRGGFGSRGGRGPRGHATNGDNVENGATTSIEDEGEVGQLKKQYGYKVSTIREMFPEWTDEDIVFALQETNGDLETTVERITDGSISQWGEVSKNKKDRSRSKVKESATTTLGETNSGQRVSRGGRSGHDGSRGGRGRGTERGRGGRGRGATPHTNGTRSKEAPEFSVPTEESSAWESVKTDGAGDGWDTSKPTTDTWASAGAEATPASASTGVSVSSIIPDGVKKTWASMFKSAPPPKKEAPPVEKAPEKVVSLNEVTIDQTQAADVAKADSDIPAKPEDTTLTQPPTFEEPDISITPSKDELTEENVEQVPDTSNPAPSLTAASTAASSWDPRSGANSATPYSALQQNQGVIRPPTSGYAASAMKATGAGGRPPSYQRRVLDQEEAVRMPGNREVDRAAVQFGAFNLGGSGDEDVDGDREEPETRAQPPQHSPVAHPRAALPPAPAAGQPESLPAQQDTTGLSSAHQAPGLQSSLPGGQNMTQQGSPGSQQFNQYGRLGQGGQDHSSFGQKPFDPFNQSSGSTQSQFDNFPGQQSQVQSQQPPNGFSSAPSDYSQFYTSEQQRNNYQSYYNQQYGQQHSAQVQPDGPSSQQRAFGGYNTQAEQTSAYPQSSAQQGQSRYATAGETQGSGNNTPNPTAQGLQQPSQSTQTQQSHPAQPQSQPGGQYPYGHPYSSSPYYAAYMNQFQQGYGQGGYGAGPYGGKAGMYSQPYQGYMSPQTPYDHSASPAVGGFGQSSLHGRDGGLGGLGDYGRAGSQPSQSGQPMGGSGSFGGMQDAFGRSSYQGQGQQYGQQSSQQGSGDDLKPFGDAKAPNGPSPSLSQAARPGSAANSAPGQSALPPPQSSQQGYGGYPNHLQQQHGSQTATQYGGLGSLGTHQSAGQGHQSGQYAGYSQGFGTSYYGNNQQQQQRGGWGNNYQH